MSSTGYGIHIHRVVFRFIIEYSSLMDFGPLDKNNLNEDF
jgi:hypothetical protein